MRVTCPACAAAYEVPEARIGSGRRLRCARCQHDWRVEPPEQPPPPATTGPFARAVAQAASVPIAAPPDVMAGGAAPLTDTLTQTAAPPRPPAPAPGPAPAPAPGPAATPALGAPPPSAPAPLAPRRDARTADLVQPLALAWMGTAVVVLCFAAAILLYRIDIIAAWPPAERFYALLGLGFTQGR